MPPAARLSRAARCRSGARLREIVCGASEFIADHRDLVSDFDLNPLICSGSDITAVDALILPAGGV